jgi:LCP family protein required for cell wall assembly
LNESPILTAPDRHRRGCRRALLIVAAALLFGCGLLSLGYALFPPPRTNILVVGLDSRAGEGYAGRTDSIMLLGIYPGQLRVSVLSLPRDLFIDVPGYGLQRVNTINLLGEQESPGQGMTLLDQAIEQNFGIQIDRYARLSFDGFTQLINAVGGVTVDVERALVDHAYPDGDDGVISVQFDAGVQEMDGERALIYARIRHPDDDYRRASRQQQVLSALLSRLVNPARWPAALEAFSNAVDSNLSLWDVVMLAPPVALTRGRFEQLVIDRDYIQGTASGNAVPNYAALDEWLNGRFR